ncbi:MAG: hypothetical protein HYX87_08600 [Chloroflexi bacterium]|nr:hypothetical protein [Chloroflexota bacterium]MBI4338460.1 hypothetical protein [Chloroflexota bacterium]
MPLYRVYGKSFHREHSDYFSEIIEARSPRAALYRLARDASGVESIGEVWWESPKPKKVGVGRLEPEPTFSPHDDELYKVRTITLVERREVTCPKCKGTGRAMVYEDVEPPFVP